MNVTNVTKICNYCRKALRPNFQQICPTCGVVTYQHKLFVGGTPQKGACDRMFKRFEGVKKLTGYGYRSNGFFCSLRCGFRYALRGFGK